jgi:hypothetical protein
MTTQRIKQTIEQAQYNVMSGGHEYSRVCELSLCELIDVVLNRTAETDGLQYVTAKQCNALVHILSARQG